MTSKKYKLKIFFFNQMDFRIFYIYVLVVRNEEIEIYFSNRSYYDIVTKLFRFQIIFICKKKKVFNEKNLAFANLPTWKRSFISFFIVSIKNGIVLNFFSNPFLKFFKTQMYFLK